MSSFLSGVPGGAQLLTASKGFDAFVNNHLNGHRMLTSIIVLGMGLYISIYLEKTPSYVVKYLDSIIVKGVIIAFALVLINPSPVLAVAITLSFFAALAVAKEQQFFERFQALSDFKPSGKPDFSETLHDRKIESNSRIAHGESMTGVFANMFPATGGYTLAQGMHDGGEDPWYDPALKFGQLAAVEQGNA